MPSLRTIFIHAVLAAVVRAAPPPLSARQSITALSQAQINAFTPLAFFASAGYCQPAATLAWNCGANCNGVPDFKPVASGGDGDSVQFCESRPP